MWHQQLADAFRLQLVLGYNLELTKPVQSMLATDTVLHNKLFGPSDGYLYFMMGDGGGSGDPYNFAQN